MVVDDNANATRITRLILERTGRYEVRELNDPRVLLDVAREFGPDLFLLDVCMPDTGGSEVAERINGDPDFAATPIVFLTCIVTPRETGKNGTLVIGQHEYMAKPAQPEQLVACIGRNLERARRRSADDSFAVHALKHSPWT
ncbi:MAG: two-component system response regulator [Verrucomicrobiia bacterium]